MVEFTDQVHACRAASVPAISVVTVEQKDVRQHLCQYAVTRGSQKTGVRPRVFEWRLVDGFKELIRLQKGKQNYASNGQCKRPIRFHRYKG